MSTCHLLSSFGAFRHSQTLNHLQKIFHRPEVLHNFSVSSQTKLHSAASQILCFSSVLINCSLCRGINERLESRGLCLSWGVLIHTDTYSYVRIHNSNSFVYLEVKWGALSKVIKLCVCLDLFVCLQAVRSIYQKWAGITYISVNLVLIFALSCNQLMILVTSTEKLLKL